MSNSNQSNGRDYSSLKIVILAIATIGFNQVIISPNKPSSNEIPPAKPNVPPYAKQEETPYSKYRKKTGPKTLEQGRLDNFLDDITKDYADPKDYPYEKIQHSYAPEKNGGFSISMSILYPPGIPHKMHTLKLLFSKEAGEKPTLKNVAAMTASDSIKYYEIPLQGDRGTHYFADGEYELYRLNKTHNLILQYKHERQEIANGVKPYSGPKIKFVPAF